MSLAMAKAMLAGGAKTASSIFNAAKVGGAGTAVSAALPAAFGVMEYNRARDEGNSVGMSVARGVGDFALAEMTGFWGYMGVQAAAAAPKAMMNTVLGIESMSRNMNKQNTSGPFAMANFVDTQQNYTMRQSGMKLAQASKYNLQQTLMGNEASHIKF